MHILMLTIIVEVYRNSYKTLLTCTDFRWNMMDGDGQNFNAHRLSRLWHARLLKLSEGLNVCPP